MNQITFKAIKDSVFGHLRLQGLNLVQDMDLLYSIWRVLCFSVYVDQSKETRFNMLPSLHVSVNMLFGEIRRVCLGVDPVHNALWLSECFSSHLTSGLML